MSTLSERGTAKGDLWGGLAAMLVAVPSSIAYGVSVYGQLGPDYVSRGVLAGMVGAIALGLVAAFLGGAPGLISAPCAPAAAVLGALAAAMAGGNGTAGTMQPDALMLILTLVGLLAGILQLIFGFARGGQLIKFIPYPVVSGYLSGVGFLIILGQLPKFLGWPKEIDGWQALLAPESWAWKSAVIGVATVAGMLAGPRITKAVPAPILGLAAGVAAYFGLGLFFPELLTLAKNKLVIGRISSDLGSILPDAAARWKGAGLLGGPELRLVFMQALTLSVLLSIDTLKTCVVMDALTRSRHRSNRELIAQGAANLVSAAAGGMPGAGTMGATLVNFHSGGKTRRSGMLAGFLALLVFALLGQLIAWIPVAALAGILIVVGFKMVDRESFKLLRCPHTVLDFCVTATVVGVAVLWNLMAAAGAGLALAVILFVRQQIRGSVIHRKTYGNRVSSLRQRLAAERAVLDESGHLLVACELQGTLFFGTSDQLYTELEPDLKRCRFVILDLRRIQSVDFTAVHTFGLIESIMREKKGFLIFSNLPAQMPAGEPLQAYFQQAGIVDGAQHVRLFDELEEALEWAEDQILQEHGLSPQETAKALDLGQIELLREFDADQTLPDLEKIAKARSLPRGETLFRRGEAGDELFLVRRGTVRVQLPLDNGKHHNLGYFGRGNFFGEMAFLDGAARSADAVSVTDTDLFILSRKQFDELSRLHPVLGAKLFARLAIGLSARLRHADAELRAWHEA